MDHSNGVFDRCHANRKYDLAICVDNSYCFPTKNYGLQSVEQFSQLVETVNTSSQEVLLNTPHILPSRIFGLHDTRWTHHNGPLNPNDLWWLHWSFCLKLHHHNLERAFFISWTADYLWSVSYSLHCLHVAIAFPCHQYPVRLSQISWLHSSKHNPCSRENSVASMVSGNSSSIALPDTAILQAPHAYRWHQWASYLHSEGFWVCWPRFCSWHTAGSSGCRMSSKGLIHGLIWMSISMPPELLRWKGCPSAV